MRRTNYRTILAGTALAMVALGGLIHASPARAGEFQVGIRLGEDWIDVDGDRVSSGNSVNDHLINLAVTVSYRWPRGGLIEAGIGGSGTIDLFGIQDVDHHWLGGGWQFDLADGWKLTPKAGLTYSELTSSEENLFESEPVDEFTDVVPFVELTLERRFGRHFGMGLYFHHTFEDWGSTRDFGLALSWTFQ